MPDAGNPAFRARLTEKLADSLAGGFPAAPPRRVHGVVSLPGKATAVVGMRRSGKTTICIRHCDVTYVRTPAGHEVDFLARPPAGETALIQVCAGVAGDEVSARELRALDEAGRTYRGATRRLLTATRDGLPAAVPAGVVAQPAYEWLVGDLV